MAKESTRMGRSVKDGGRDGAGETMKRKRWKQGTALKNIVIEGRVETGGGETAAAVK
jgi:hypothetical protein